MIVVVVVVGWHRSSKLPLFWRALLNAIFVPHTSKPYNNTTPIKLLRRRDALGKRLAAAARRIVSLLQQDDARLHAYKFH